MKINRRELTKFLRPADPFLASVTLILVVIGLLMIYSSSAFLAAERYGDATYFIKKEILFVVIGAGLALGVQRVPPQFWRDHVYWILGISALLLLLVWVPGIGASAGGARRWIRLGGLRFQPSELTKLALIIFMAYSLAKKGEKIRKFAVGMIPHSVVPGIFLAAILLQKDLGSVVTIGLVIVVLLFVAGLRLSHLAAVVILFAHAFIAMIAAAQYRRERIAAFLDPWSHRLDSGFQIIQSLVSFKSGGLSGQGLGGGQQKLFFLPEAHTDFILAVIAEELGWIGVASVLSLFAVFLTRAFMIAFKSPDPFGFYLGLGISLMLAVQILFNAGVVMAILPTKGMPLPFISYGGSNLAVSFIGVGMLMALSKNQWGVVH